MSLEMLRPFQSHKVVYAAKIVGITTTNEGAVFTLDPSWKNENSEVFTLPVDAAYLQKHKPTVGGWFVHYGDGYCSWSPAKAFEEGYTPIPEPEGEADGEKVA